MPIDIFVNNINFKQSVFIKLVWPKFSFLNKLCWAIERLINIEKYNIGSKVLTKSSKPHQGPKWKKTSNSPSRNLNLHKMRTTSTSKCSTQRMSIRKRKLSPKQSSHGKIKKSSSTTLMDKSSPRSMKRINPRSMKSMSLGINSQYSLMLKSIRKHSLLEESLSP